MGSKTTRNTFINSVIRRSFLLGLSFILFLPAFCQTNHTSGIAILDIGNKRDIYDQRNGDALLKLKQEAVIDAIEKVATVSISVRSELSVSEHGINGQNAFFEQFVNNVLQRYNVRWTRTGDYELQQDPNRKRVWICRVSGTVEIGDEFEADPILETPTQPFIRAKRGKRIYCTEGTAFELRVGQKIEVLKEQDVNAGSGSIVANKVVGQAIITETQDRSATAEIVSGRYSIKDGYTVRPADFPVVAGGIKVGFFFTDEKVGIRESGSDSLRQINGISIDYFELSKIKHYGVTFGVDLISDQVSDSSNNTSAIVRFGLMRPIAVLPEYVFLTPSISFGYAALSEEYGIGTTGRFAMQMQVEGGMRSGILEIGVGLRYNYIHGFDQLSNLYPIATFSLDLLRFARGAQDRDAPGFGMLMDLLDQ